MKNPILKVLCILLACALPASAADVKLTDLTATTTLASTDLLLATVDPAGTPASRKITFANFKTALSLQPLDSDLTALAALTTATYGRSLLEVANEAALKALVNLEAGTDFNAYRAEVDKLALKGTDIASASSIDLGAATGETVDVTGTTTITALGTVAAGTTRTVRFTGALTLTHNGTSLILPGAANITTTAGDVARFVSLGSGNWLCTDYEPTVAPARAELGRLGIKGSNIASATTTDLSTATGDFVDVTGTTTITGLGTATAGTERTVRFSGVLTLTHNSTSLILPGGANITTVAGDTAIFRSLGSGNWRCITYQRSTALPLLQALPLQITTGGDARGTYAVDLQGARDNDTQVASGDSAFLVGQANTASGNRAFASGSYNTSSGDDSFCMGVSNQATAANTLAAGGFNQASGLNSTAIGLENVASSSYTLATGHGATARITGAHAHSSGYFILPGDSQSLRAIARIQTTDATLTELRLDGATARFTIPTDTLVAVTVRIAAAKSGLGASSGAYFQRTCVITNTGGTTALQGSVQTLGTDIDTMTLGGITITADDTNDSLKLGVTGKSGTDLAWVATIDAIEIRY